jgi:tRNA nucleotidyltransferase/poly(A) polymerase
VYTVKQGIELTEKEHSIFSFLLKVIKDNNKST